MNATSCKPNLKSNKNRGFKKELKKISTNKRSKQQKTM